MKLLTNLSKQILCMHPVILLAVFLSGPALAIDFDRSLQWLGNDNTFDIALADLDGGTNFWKGVENQVWLNSDNHRQSKGRTSLTY